MQETTVRCPVNGSRIGTFKRNAKNWEAERHDGGVAETEIAPSIPGATVIVLATLHERSPADWKAAEAEATRQIRAEVEAAGLSLTTEEEQARVAQVMRLARDGDEGVVDALKLPPERWVDVRTLHDVSPAALVLIRDALRDGCGMTGALEVPL